MHPYMLSAEDHLASAPKTILYLTLICELRGDTKQYTYSIDRCYTSLTRANERLSFLSRCNFDEIISEELRAGEDPVTGCQWCTWSCPDDASSKFRFYGEVKKVIMHGTVRRHGPSEEEEAAFSGGAASSAKYRSLREHKKDLANHIWAVAMHFPKSDVIVDRNGRPTCVPWILESVHEASGNAMARGKRLWRDKMQPTEDKFDRLDLHFGYARYLLVPQSAGITVSDKRQSIGGMQRDTMSGIAQIRVERIKIMPEEEMLAWFAPAEAITYNKIFRPLVSTNTILPDAPKVEAELLDLLSDADEKKGDLHRDVVDQTSGRSSPAPTNRATVPPSKRTFRQHAVREYGKFSIALRESLSPTPDAQTPKTMRKRRGSKGKGEHRASVSRGLVKVASKGELTAPSVDKNGSPRQKQERCPEVFDSSGTAGTSPETPRQVALAARQKLVLASRPKT